MEGKILLLPDCQVGLFSWVHDGDMALRLLVEPGKLMLLSGS